MSFLWSSFKIVLSLGTGHEMLTVSAEIKMYPFPVLCVLCALQANQKVPSRNTVCLILRHEKSISGRKW